MNVTLQEHVQLELCPEGFWQLRSLLKSVLRRQILRLPERKVTEMEIRYPVTPASMRAFLEVFFTRHYLQIQNSLISYMCSPDFLDTVLSGHLRILDIGSGPAVASLAITDMLACILGCLENLGYAPQRSMIEATYVLNDTSTICLGTGQRMLTDYFRMTGNNVGRILRSQTIGIQHGFPNNMGQLRRIANNFGTYDIVILSYVLTPLVEEIGFTDLVDGVAMLEASCASGGRILIVQDRFRRSLIRRVCKALGTSSHRKELTLHVFPDRGIGETFPYAHYCCLYEPNGQAISRASYVA